MSFAIRVDQDYYKLTFEYEGDSSNLSNLTTPYPDLPVHFDVFINNIQVTTTTYGAGFLTQLSSRFVAFWGRLEYDATVHIADNSTHSFDLNLKCKVFSNYATSNHLCNMHLTLSVLTHSEYLSIDDIYPKFDYLLVSWYLNAEVHFPLVFSYVGRNFVKLNAFWYRRIRRDALGSDSFELDRLLPSLVARITADLVVCKLLQHTGKLLPFFDDPPRKSHNIVKAFPVRLLDY
ncbi:hypothetical protein Cantr_06756 [Candida viswanathii]|uniref:Uncharacterized protein n=1 Tax=Candida viswanathii TaxID=5486 RepID=A0A367XV54_9ASCO|nr:hypothetical protein Cantr_06756 [Candida viswanathii]